MLNLWVTIEKKHGATVDAMLQWIGKKVMRACHFAIMLWLMTWYLSFTLLKVYGKALCAFLGIRTSGVENGRK